MNQMTESELFAQCVRELKLPTFKENIEETISEATEGGWSYRKFLCALMEKEVDRRLDNRTHQRMKRANFSQMKYLHELVREDLPAECRNLLPELETLNFVKDGRNIVMYGNPGTGKTHTAIGLGIKACLEGYSVYFTTVPQLLMLIREAQTGHVLRRFQERFTRYDLVICDEFGYVSFDKEGGEQIFNLLSLRAGKKSTITTTNLPFTRWEEIIKDKALCSALVDRLCHKAFLVNMTGQSYRVKETKMMLENLL